MTYLDYQKRFLEIASKQNLHLKQVEISARGPEGEALFINFAYRLTGSVKTIVHITGVHGVEGYIGADIQNEIISNHLEGIHNNIIFIHPVNPHGMAWCRRVNENNVDLNRNGFLPGESRPNAERFTLFRKLLVGDSYLKLSMGLPALLKLFLIHGKAQSFRDIAEGQYEFQDAPFYGGRELQEQLKILVIALKEIAQQTKAWHCLDVHTGLGPWAHESLILNEVNTSDESSFFRDTFVGGDIIDPLKKSGYYQPHGLVGPYLKKSGLGGEVLHITQEFGTYHYLRVFGKLIIESSRYSKNDFDPKFAESIRNLFYPHDPAWRKKVIAIGVKRFVELASKPEV